jgi:hypothetical protein
MKAKTLLCLASALLFWTLTGPVQSAAAALTEGVVSYWQFDEPNGTTAWDSVGQNDGNIHDATRTTGQVNGALNFDGTEDYVEIPSSFSLDPNTATWSFWIKPTANPGGSGDSPSGACAVISRHDAQDSKHGVLLMLVPHTTYGTIKPFVLSSTSVLTQGTVYLPQDVNYGSWTHIAFVFNAGNYAELYINGSLAVDYTLGSFNFNNQVLRIATSIDPYFYDYNGQIDEVVIYNRTLSATEIQQIYEVGLSQQTLPLDNLIAARKIHRYLDKKLQALQELNEQLQIEYNAYNALRSLLQTGAYSSSENRNISVAMQDISAAIRDDEQSRNDLTKSIEKLQNVLTILAADT